MSTILITIRVMPNGDEVEVDLPLNTSGKKIKSELMNAGVIQQRGSDGHPLVYKLIAKNTNNTLDDHKTLGDLGVQSGDTLILVPDLVAGGTG